MEKATYDLKKIENGEALSRAMQEAHANRKRNSMEKETLEEAAEINCESITHPYCDREKAMFIKGAKWQQERMYSEEEVQELLIYCKDRFGGSGLEDYTADVEVKEWFEQFKKK